MRLPEKAVVVRDLVAIQQKLLAVSFSRYLFLGLRYGLSTNVLVVMVISTLLQTSFLIVLN